MQSPGASKLAAKSRPQPGLNPANSLTAEAQRRRCVPLGEALDVECGRWTRRTSGSSDSKYLSTTAIVR